MPIEQVSNSATTTLSAGINSSDASLSVASASLFPTSGRFRVLIDSEILIVTAVSGTTFTVTRGAEGTTGASHSSGATVRLILTAASFDAYVRDRGAFSVGLADMKPAVAGTYDEEFEGTADTLPANWSWSATPSGSDSWTLNSRWPSMLTLDGTGSANYLLTRSSFAPGSGDFGLWWKIFCGPHTGIEVSNFRAVISNSGDTEAQTWELYAAGTELVKMRGLYTASGSESLGFGGSSGMQIAPDSTGMYGGMTRTSGDVWTMWYSRNGISWQRYGSTQTHSFTVGKFNFSLNTGSIRTVSAIDWVRFRSDLEFPRP